MDDQAWPGDRGDWNGLTQDLRVRINWARRRSLEHGHYITQVSGNRTYEQQVQLRRQNCGTSDYAIYRAPPSSCRPVTAIPGTSNHEDGNASDLSPGPRSCPQCAAIFAQAGLGFPVRSEDWHTEVISNSPLPDAPPPPAPPEEDMANDYLVAHRDGRIVLVNGNTNRWSLMGSPDIVNYTKNLYALTGRTLEDHTQDVDGGTALIDFRIINEV